MVGLKICEDEYFDEKRQEYVMESFEFSNGKVLENVNVEYMTFGTPKYDEDGNKIEGRGLYKICEELQNQINNI